MRQIVSLDRSTHVLLVTSCSLGYRFLSEKKDVQYLFILIYRNGVTQDVLWEDPNSSEKNQLRPEALDAT